MRRAISTREAVADQLKQIQNLARTHLAAVTHQVLGDAVTPSPAICLRNTEIGESVFWGVFCGVSQPATSRIPALPPPSAICSAARHARRTKVRKPRRRTK